MAILTKKLDLADGVWQEVGAISFIFTKGTGHIIELVNADALPNGTVEEAMLLSRADFQIIPAPASGSYFVRVASGTGVLKYSEV